MFDFPHRTEKNNNNNNENQRHKHQLWLSHIVSIETFERKKNAGVKAFNATEIRRIKWTK